MSDSGRTSDFYRRDLGRCARDWATTKNWDVPKPLRDRLVQIAEALEAASVGAAGGDTKMQISVYSALQPESHAEGQSPIAALCGRLTATAEYIEEQFENKRWARQLNGDKIPDWDCEAITTKVAEQDGIVEMLREAAALLQAQDRHATAAQTTKATSEFSGAGGEPVPAMTTAPEEQAANCGKPGIKCVAGRDGRCMFCAAIVGSQKR